MELKVKLLEPWAKLPTRAESTAVGFDVYIHEPKETINGVTFYRTGIAIEPPQGMYFLLYPRSSLSKTGWMMANSVGVIDSSYRGELLVALHKTADAVQLTLPGRYAQLVPQMYMSHTIPVLEVKELTSTERGTGGYGSTGIA